MKWLPRCAAFLYVVMLRCYPRSFRLRFGEEMQGVFLEASTDASHSTKWGPLLVFMRELADWPQALVNTYLDIVKASMPLGLQARGPNSMPRGRVRREVARMISRYELINVDRRQAMIGALPPVLLGLGIMLAALIRTDVWYRLPTWQLYLSVGIAAVPAVAVSIGGLLALLKRIPDWGLTWLGAAFMGTTLFVQVLLGEGVEEGWLSVSAGQEIAIDLAFFLTGVLLLLITANRGWSRGGLFTIAAAATMGLSLFQSVTAAPFNREDVAVSAGPWGVLFGILIYAYFLQFAIPRVLIISGVGILNVGAALIATNALRSWFENRGATSPLLPLLVILTGLLLSGPLSALSLGPIKRLVRGSRPAD